MNDKEWPGCVAVTRQYPADSLTDMRYAAMPVHSMDSILQIISYPVATREDLSTDLEAFPLITVQTSLLQPHVLKLDGENLQVQDVTAFMTVEWARYGLKSCRPAEGSKNLKVSRPTMP